MNIDYRTIPQKDLAKFVLSEGGWSKLLCTGEKVRRLVDVAIVFVGKEDLSKRTLLLLKRKMAQPLYFDYFIFYTVKCGYDVSIMSLQSSAISGNEHENPTLLHLIKDSFSRSNFSMAFPFVAASEESSNMENSLITGFTNHCGHDLEHKNVDVLESFGFVVHASYASDPYRSMQYPSYKALARFLAEGGNGSDNSTTYYDGVCHIKSSLLEGLLVLQMRRQELTQTTTDQPVDDEAVYYKVAGDCPKGCVYSLRSLWRKKRKYVDPDASTSQMLAQRGMCNFMILSTPKELLEGLQAME
ncbi:hypothetical protein Syun_025917 [Stephania yunnanensis]|uniref:Uncharacterized protein n=1 Tax=Stephania yunnanensis TaxID=152371 RepID=A0AAP0EVG7_9MAGN